MSDESAVGVTSENLKVHSPSLALIGLPHVALTFAIWRSKPQRRINRLFALRTLSFAGWTFGNALLHLRMWLSAANLLAFASASLIPAFMLTLILNCPDSKRRAVGPWERSVFGIAALFALASLTTIWMAYNFRLEGGKLSREPGVLCPFPGGYFIVVFGAGLLIFALKWWRARERERAQLNYYGLGLVIAAACGITSNLIIPATTGSSSFSHFGHYFGLPLIALTAHTIIRHRFIDLRVVVHRGLTFTIAMLLSSVPALALFLLVGPSMLARRRLPEAMAAVGVLLSVALLIPLPRDVAERFLDRSLYRARINTQHLLRHASTEITHALGLTRVLGVIVDTIHAAVKPEGVATYLRSDWALRLSSVRALDPRGRFSAPLDPAAPLVNDLLARREVLVRDELDRREGFCSGIAERHHGRLTVGNAEGSAAGFTLAIPLVVGSHLRHSQEDTEPA